MAEEVKELLIKVSATTELLRSNLVAAEREIAKFQTTTDAVTQRVDRNFKQVGQSAGNLKSGMQQLSFQVNDMATMFAMGARPMQIFASQAGQVIQSVQVMAGGTSGLAAFLGGPWGLALTTAAVVMAPFIAKLFDTVTAADTARSALQSLIEKQRELQAERIKETNAEGALNALRDKRIRIENQISRLRSQGRDTSVREQDLRQTRLQIIEAEGAINANQARNSPTQTATTPTRVVGGGGGRSRGGLVGRVTAPDNDNPITPEIAFRAEMSKFTDEQAKALARVRDDDFQDNIELINKKADYEFEARREVLDRLRQAEARQIDFLAGMFEDAFRGGTNAIWQNFESIGLAVISRVLAQFAASKISGKGGFDLGGAVSSAFTAILGYADGGRPPVGRVSMVGERGPELFVPDAAGTIIPNHALGGGGMNFTINAPGATAETVSMIRRELANAAPALISAASGNTVRALNRKSL